MFLPDNEKSLRNIEDSFYYCGIEVSKKQFDISEFALVCKRINDLKHILYTEKYLSILKKDYEIISEIPLYNTTSCICSVYKEKCFISLYDEEKKEIKAFTKEDLLYFKTDFYNDLSNQMNKTAKRAQNRIIPIKQNTATSILNISKYISFQNYKHNIESLSICFYKTEDLEFIKGYKDYISTDEQLSEALENLDIE